MKIAVVGCGAVGSYYGACLARAGQDVHFLLRSGYEAVRRNGVSIRSPRGDFCVRPVCARSPEEIGRADLVLVGLKTTANDQFEHLLPPLAGPDSAILTLQNGLGNEERLARLFPARQILGGLCFVCLNRIDPGLIVHFDHGLVVLGEFQRAPVARTHELAAMFDSARIPCKTTDCLERAHWEKLVWNIPFNGLGVASGAGYEAMAEAAASLTAGALAGPAQRADMEVPALGGERSQVSVAPSILARLGPCLTTDKLLGDPRWARLVRELMLEVIAASRALGFAIPESLADSMIERTRTMGAYRASTLIDFEQGKPLELESLFLEPLRRARQAGSAAPRLAALCAVLEEMERRRTGP